jgi:hypothetical protein
MGVDPPFRHAWQRAFLRVSMALLPVAFGASALVAPSGATPSRPDPIAVATRTLNLNLNANYHLVGRPGHMISEQGSFTGTLSGTLISRSVVVSSTLGTGTFTLYTKGGSLSGEATSHARVVGPIGYFSGTAKITKGTGKWAHSPGSTLAFSGTVNRQNYHFVEHVTGSLRY